MTYSDYKRAMLRRFIAYRRKHYPLEDEQFQAVQAALQGPATLKRTTWQAIAGVLLEQVGTKV